MVGLSPLPGSSRCPRHACFDVPHEVLDPVADQTADLGEAGTCSEQPTSSEEGYRAVKKHGGLFLVQQVVRHQAAAFSIGPGGAGLVLPALLFFSVFADASSHLSAIRGSTR